MILSVLNTWTLAWRVTWRMPLICLNVQLLLVTKVVVKRIVKSSLSNFSQYYSTAEDTKGIYKMTY